MGQFEYEIQKSLILRQLDFSLFNDLIKDLGENYLITIKDINLLIILNQFYSMKGKNETMKGILNFIDRMMKTKDERELLYEIHCDPYELFIDAGRIDRELKIII